MKYWYALRYGSRETKRYLWSVLLGSMLTVAALIYSIGKRSWIGGLAALFFGIVTLIIWQSKSLSDQELEKEEEEKEEEEEGQKEGKTQKEQKTKQTEKTKVKQLSSKAKVSSKVKVSSETDVSSEAEKGLEAEEKPEEAELYVDFDAEQVLGQGEEPGAEEEKKNKNKETEQPKEEEAVVSDYNTYSPAVLKKAMHRYRVKREHRPVMIDSCPSKGIRECPAYLWRDRHKAYLLLLEKKPRRIEYPLEKMAFLEYQRAVEASPDKEYPAFQKNSPVTSVFKAFLPDYYQRRKNGVISDLKNLYRMAGDLAFTNTSVKNVMEVLKPGFRVKDAVTSGNRYGAYFTESYQQNILLRDRVLEVDEYKERMKGLLQQMAQEEISLREFQHRLEELVEYRFITEDFADYFLEYRAKLDLVKAGQK